MDHHATIGQQRQRGYVLLSMVAVIGLLTATAATSIGETALVRQQSDKNKMVLAKAREALISRAASDANHPGSLPCPDAVTNIPGNNIPNDGIADLLSGTACPSAIGRLPWRTLGLPDLRDADGERLWYLLATAYQDSTAKIINPSTGGQIAGYECTENAPASPVWPCAAPRLVSPALWVAVIFAPGKLLPGQNRDAAHTGDVLQFLESYNAAEPLKLRTAAGGAHNDRLSGITADDLFAIVQRRVAREVQSALSLYRTTTTPGQTRLPVPAVQCTSSTLCDAAPLTAVPPATARGYLPSNDSRLNQIMAAQNMSWFDRNHWRNTMTYTMDTRCATERAGEPCGMALATASTPPFASGTLLIGGANNAVPSGTRAIISFAGVSTVSGGATKTRLAFAIQ